MAAKKPATSADAARKANEKTIKKGTKSTQTKGLSTGAKKALNAPDKIYNAPAKGSGKVKYQNTTKEARLNTKERSVKGTEKIKNIMGRNVTQQEKRALGNKVTNIPKMIDREYKEQKGVRTAKPSTAKVPVKPRGGRGGLGGLNINNLKK